MLLVALAVGFPEVIVDVTRPSQLDEVKAGVAAVQELAVDVEADSMHHFRASLCFVQALVTADGEPCARANATFKVLGGNVLREP